MVCAALLAVTLVPGKLFLVGGGSTPPEVVDRFIKECGGPKGLIIVMPLPSQEPEKSTGSADLLKKHGAENVYQWGYTEPTDAQRDELKKRFADVKGIWIPGGQQARFVTRLGKAWIDANIPPLVKRGVHVYGTSAGAMLCSDPMIEGPGEAPDTSRTGPGIGLTKWIIDTHFSQRKREPRLRFAMKAVKNPYGLGLSEKEWVVIQGDTILEKHGNPMVIDESKR